MAGDEVADGIGTYCVPHSPAGAGRSQASGEIPVGSDIAGGDFEQRLPDLDLEIGAFHEQEEGGTRLREAGWE